ncbi:MAG: hypothetical protein R6U38_01010 [Desulfatiglandaceae bacterium]
MQVERLILETDQFGKPKNLPKLPPNKQLEIILLSLDDVNKKKTPHRSPHPNIMGKTRILGDIISSVPEGDWDLKN